MTEIGNLIAKKGQPAKGQTLLDTFHEVLVEAIFKQNWQLNRVDDRFGQCLRRARQQKRAEFLAPSKERIHFVQSHPV